MFANCASEHWQSCRPVISALDSKAHLALLRHSLLSKWMRSSWGALWEVAAAAKSLVSLASVNSSGSFLWSPDTPQDHSIQSIRYDLEGFLVLLCFGFDPMSIRTWSTGRSFVISLRGWSLWSFSSWISLQKNKQFCSLVLWAQCCPYLHFCKIYMAKNVVHLFGIWLFFKARIVGFPNINAHTGFVIWNSCRLLLMFPFWPKLLGVTRLKAVKMT